MADVVDRHADHDPLLIVALTDDDISASERTVAVALIGGCADCAALHADLLALSSATRALPIPPRPRDFRLTAADAARLTAPTAGEPAAPASRLTGEMTDSRSTSAHASHDTILVASLADHSLAASEREAADALVAACGLCAALNADLVALSAATRAMSTPTRPRDYTLTPDDAARLRPTGWRRWVAAFGTSRDAFSRPLAVGLTTLGLAGLLVATVPSVLLQGSATSAPSGAQDTTGNAGGAPGAVTDAGAESASRSADPGAPAAAPSADYAGPVAASAQPTPVVSDRNGVAILPDQASPAPAQGGTTTGSSKGSDAGPGQPDALSGTGAERTAAEQGATGIPTMIVVSGALVLVGLGLFLMRRATRRFGA